MVVYAKSTGETLREHTLTLLKAYEILKSFYKDKINNNLPKSFAPFFWKALKISAISHDLGKIHTPFQNLIRKHLNLELLEVPKNVPEIPHNLISPAFLSEAVADFPTDVQKAIYQAVAFHHDKEREQQYENDQEKWKEVKTTLEADILPNLSRLNDIKDIASIPTELNLIYQKKIFPRIRPCDGDLYLFYLFLKGLLHRLDHAASAHVNVEEKPPLLGRDMTTEQYLLHKGITPSQIWQSSAKNLKDKNIVLTASTGIGKTEFAWYWLDRNKSFYTLPVRTSVNAMYERAKTTFSEEKIGLLHSDSVFYLLAEGEHSNQEGMSSNLHILDSTRQFAMPLTITTADQLFTSVFKFGGYEKIYATLGYSKIIVDEIQSYDPEISAVILIGLRELAKIGAHFCIITATLPPLYEEYAKKIPDIYFCEPRFLKAPKHFIILKPGEISDDENINELMRLAEINKRLLIVVNTIKTAQTLYRKLSDQCKKCSNQMLNKVHLLHSGFIYKDRQEKEQQILKEGDAQEIWISTQLVEASLDIDFPVLATEVAAWDSLVQRMGRVLRKIKSDDEISITSFPNVYIFEEGSGIGTIYDQEIVSLTLQELKKINGRKISDKEKQEILSSILNPQQLKGTKYLRKFQRSVELLESGFSATTKAEAQNLFRNITNLEVIPFSIYAVNFQKIYAAIQKIKQKGAPREERFKALSLIRQFSLSVPYYKVKDTVKLEGDLFITTLQYDKNLGLIPNEKVSNIL